MIYSLSSVKENPEKLEALLKGMKGIMEKELNVVSFENIYVVVSD